MQKQIGGKTPGSMKSHELIKRYAISTLNIGNIEDTSNNVSKVLSISRQEMFRFH